MTVWKESFNFKSKIKIKIAKIANFNFCPNIDF